MTRKTVAALILVALGLAAAPLDTARDLYLRTEYEAALKLLKSMPQNDAGVLALTGKAHFMTGDFVKASQVFEKAVAIDPGNSQYRNWLGKSYGRRAETSSFLSAARYAGRARDNFEKAVELDSRNLEAVNDLFEYYLEAPGFMGGGFEKASALAERIKVLNPAEYYWAQSRLAEKRKQYANAEQQLRRAMDLAPQQVGRVLDLASFLAKQGRLEESEATFERAAKLAPNSPRLLFERAKAYIKAKRNVSEAQEMLKQYLKSDLTPDDPSRAEAERLLKESAGG